MTARRSLAVATAGLLLAALPAVSSAGPSPVPPTGPPPTDLGSFGKLRVKESFDMDRGVPIGGWRSFVIVTRLSTGEDLVEAELVYQNVNAPSLPYVGTFARGRYRITGYWRVGSDVIINGQPPPISAPSNLCSRTLKLAPGDRNKVVIVRDSAGCKIEIPKDRQPKR